MDEIGTNALEVAQLMEKIALELPVEYRKVFSDIAKLLVRYEEDRQSQTECIKRLLELLDQSFSLLQKQVDKKIQITPGPIGHWGGEVTT